MPARLRFIKPHNAVQLWLELRAAGVACKLEENTDSNPFWIYIENPALEPMIKSVVEAHVPLGTGADQPIPIVDGGLL